MAYVIRKKVDTSMSHPGPDWMWFYLAGITYTKGELTLSIAGKVYDEDLSFYWRCDAGYFFIEKEVAEYYCNDLIKEDCEVVDISESYF